jgi:hypothetical protein
MLAYQPLWRHYLKLSGRDEVQHLVDGEVASAVSGSDVGRVAELGPEVSGGLIVAGSVGHPDPRSDRAADTVSRAE